MKIQRLNSLLANEWISAVDLKFGFTEITPDKQEANLAGIFCNTGLLFTGEVTQKWLFALNGKLSFRH